MHFIILIGPIKLTVEICQGGPPAFDYENEIKKKKYLKRPIGSYSNFQKMILKKLSFLANFEPSWIPKSKIGNTHAIRKNYYRM